MSELLVQVTARHFCAGIICRNGYVIEAAPILKWSVGKSEQFLVDYFKRKGWSYKVV